MRGLPLGLSESGRRGGPRWQYRPARGEAGPVASRKEVRIEFRLRSLIGRRAVYNFSIRCSRFSTRRTAARRSSTLSSDQATIGRATDNDIVLNDFSVSRRHAYLRRENGVWILRDNHSTNGVRVNDQPVPECARHGRRRGGHRHVPLRVPGGRRPEAARARASRLDLDLHSPDLRVQSRLRAREGRGRVGPSPPHKRKRVVLDVAYKNKVFEILVQVAKTLISADDLETVLEKVMDLIFEYLPVDRGFLLLEEEGALQLRCRAFGSGSAATSDGSAPYSRTIVDMVMRQKVAVLTSDAQADAAVRGRRCRSACSRSARRCARRSGTATRSSA